MTPPHSNLKVAVIGGGIVGLATAHELLSRFPYLSLAMFEKESRLAAHQTGHNSGVIHSGIYYKPGSLKARLCVEGTGKLLEFCRQHAIPFDLCGKIIVATQPSELPQLEELYRRGTGNGLQDLKILSAEEIREREPHAAGLRGIHVPATGIVDYSLVAEKLGECILALGGSIHLAHRVTGLNDAGECIHVQTDQGAFRADLVINCAGLHSDQVTQMAGLDLDLRIVPFRGEYYDLRPASEQLVRGLIYPVPDPRFPFLGVHFTRRIGGGVEAGPNAVLAFAREGYTKTSFQPSEVFGYAVFPGFWKLAAKHWKMSLGEIHRSLNKTAFVRALQRLIPEITANDLVPGGSGVRAQALHRDGSLLDDFHFVCSERMVHVCNVPSPAATASLAIARHIVDTVVQRVADGLLPGDTLQTSAKSISFVQA